MDPISRSGICGLMADLWIKPQVLSFADRQMITITQLSRYMKQTKAGTNPDPAGPKAHDCDIQLFTSDFF